MLLYGTCMKKVVVLLWIPTYNIPFHCVSFSESFPPACAEQGPGWIHLFPRQTYPSQPASLPQTTPPAWTQEQCDCYMLHMHITLMNILYSGRLSREKLLWIGKRDHFMENTFTGGSKTGNFWKFSPSKVFCYTVWHNYILSVPSSIILNSSFSKQFPLIFK